MVKVESGEVGGGVMVFEKVVCWEGRLKKLWVVERIEEGRIEGKGLIVGGRKKGDRGMLEKDVLLGEGGNGEIEKVGGKGKELWVLGRK